MSSDRVLAGLAEAVDGLAAVLVARAATRTTIGRERSLLRLLGLGGLDAAGRPLAAELVDGYVAGGPGRLASGLGLPLAMASLEYDLPPKQLGLDIAAGTVDLSMEAELLRDPARRAAAEAELDRLLDGAFARIDANRTARAELLGVLGDASRPWVGMALREPAIAQAGVEARAAVRAGADLVRVQVPAGRELVVRLGEAGIEVPPWSPRADTPGSESEGEPAPTGSQRGLAVLRRVLDEAAAARGAYVRLLTAPPALGAPEGAVVAAFERVDLVEADPVAEIVGAGVHPDRALADHVHAARLLAHAGIGVLLGAGTVAVAPDLVAGLPADPATRAGRALALQLLAARLLVLAGLPAEAVLVSALPPWLPGEDHPAARAAAEIALRRALLPGHPLAFVEPDPAPQRGPAWPFIVAPLLGPGGSTALMHRSAAADGGAGALARAALEVRSAAQVAAELATSPGGLEDLPGPAREHVHAALAAAAGTIGEIATTGWDRLVGTGPNGSLGLGGDAVVERLPGDLLERRLGGPPTA